MKAVAGAVLLFFSWQAMAGNGISIMAGEGNADTRYAGISWQWDMSQRWFTDGNWEVAGYWEVNLSHWKRDNNNTTQNHSLTEAGITPVFRLQSKSPVMAGLSPYVELGIGVHMLSETEIDGRNLSSSFQFGEHLGLGFTFGKQNEFDLGYRLQHLSNAGIKQPNDGITFHELRFGYLYK